MLGVLQALFALGHCLQEGASAGRQATFPACTTECVWVMCVAAGGGPLCVLHSAQHAEYFGQLAADGAVQSAHGVAAAGTEWLGCFETVKNYADSSPQHNLGHLGRAGVCACML